MHEYGLIINLFNKIDEVVKRENAQYANKVHVELGALAHISPDHFKAHFDEMRKNTVAEKAQLIITENLDKQHPHAQEIRLVSVDVSD